MDNKTISFELAKKYAFEKFDFKNGTPEELLSLYKDAENTIYSILENESEKLLNESLKDWLES